MGESTVFSTNGDEETGYPQAKEWTLIFTYYHIQKLKCIKDLNVRHKTMQFLEENEGQKFLNFDMTMLS